MQKYKYDKKIAINTIFFLRPKEHKRKKNRNK